MDPLVKIAVQPGFTVYGVGVAKPAIRFGLWYSPEIRSSSWKVGFGSDSTVYVINRPIGNAVKVSLHQRDSERSGHEWRFALTQEYLDSGPDPDQPRVGDSWDSEQRRIPDSPLKVGFAVVLGRFSLGYHTPQESLEDALREERELQTVDWITDLPTVDQAWQVTVIVVDPGIPSTPPGTRAMGSIPLGKLDLPNSSEVWVMRDLIPITDEMRANITNGTNFALSELENEPSDGVHRVLLQGKEEGGLRYWLESAATKGAPPGVLDIDP